MRYIFFGLLVLASGMPLSGQKKIEKVPDLVQAKDEYLFSGRLDSAQYNYFLNGILKEQFDARRIRLKEAMKSPESLTLLRNKLKNEYLNLLGSMPERTPLNPVITGKIRKDGYSIEKVAFESRPDYHVTALLYIPEGKGPFPAVLHMPGHSYTAKGRDYYQRIGRYFAINGFVVLQVDPVCQGERCQICEDTAAVRPGKTGTPLEQNTTGQHELYNEGLLLVGSSMVAWEAWDNIRSIDYLCSRSEVDTLKIGITGLSGGGTQTTYLVSLDPRIKAAAPSSYIATTEEKYKTIGSQDGCQQLWSEGKLGIEEQDFLFMAAPLPILVLSTFGDFFSYKGSLVAVNELHQMYKVLGYPDNVKQFSTSGEHGMTYKSIDADVRWMAMWLKGNSAGVICDTLNPDFLLPDETLVTATGQVLSSFKNEKSILDYSVKLMEETRVSRSEFLSSCTRADLVQKAAELIGYENAENIHGGIQRGSFIWEGLTIEKHLINRDRGFSLPAYIIRPAAKTGKKNQAILLAGCFGKMNELAANKKLILEKLEMGYTVMVVDVTNTGELRTPEQGTCLNYEFSVAKMPVYAGRTLLGYRTQDMVIAKNYLKKLSNAAMVELFASEQLVPCAIHAAFIDGGFSKLYLKNCPDSWEKLVKTHFKPDNIGIIVPNVLKFYDIPDLLKFMSKIIVEYL